MSINYNTHAKRVRYAKIRQNIITGILALIIGFILFQVLQTKLANTKSRVTHSDRYSHEYKFRPAASPIVTEYLQDGSIRLRGANFHDTHAVWRDEL